MFISSIVTGFSQNADNSDAVYDNAAPTDLSDIIEIYERYGGGNLPDNVGNELVYYNDSAIHKVFKDSSYAIELPQYNKSKNPCVANAEWIFNSCAFTFNVLSNQEMFIREIGGDSLINCTEAISSRFIKNDTIRTCAEKYREQVVEIMKKSEAGNSDILDVTYRYLQDVMNASQGSIYKPFDDFQVLYDLQDTMFADMKRLTEKTINKYVETPADERLSMMLGALNSCKTFDEQCSLLIYWADRKESRQENFWIIAVSERLMESGKYNPLIEQIWAMWRCLKQWYCYGLSRDSIIPNDEFNEMRKKCYVTIVDRMERHPGDILALGCSINIAGRYNMNRYGRYYFGNESSIEMMELMPGRYQN